LRLAFISGSVIGDEHAVVVVKTDQMPVEGAIMQGGSDQITVRGKPLRLVLLPAEQCGLR